jgi:hypothetical protein
MMTRMEWATATWAFGLAAAAGDPAVAFAGGGGGAGGVDRGLAEGPAQPGIALTFFPARDLGPGWRAEGHSPAHETRSASVGTGTCPGRFWR